MAKLSLKDAARVDRIAAEVLEEPAAELTGSRGGKTVTRAGLLRKSAFFDPEEWEAIRRRAETDKQSFAVVIRRAVRRFVDLPDLDL